MINSYFVDIEYYIIKHIRQADAKLLIAVAWFTNQKIGDELLQLKDIEIEIVVDDNPINRNSRVLKDLSNHNVKISFITDSEKKQYLMHNKFCVIDDKFAITGSYNWTENAKKNEENITVLTEIPTIAYYSSEFRRLAQIGNPEKPISMSPEEINEIVSLIYKGLKTFLKLNINKLESGLITNWADKTILRKIYTIEEKVTVSLNSNVSESWMFKELRKKYGSFYMELASEEEKAEFRDKHRKQHLEYFPEMVFKDFQRLKIRAIQQLQGKYSELIKVNKNDVEVSRILKVIMFLNHEKLEIHNFIMEN